MLKRELAAVTLLMMILGVSASAYSQAPPDAATLIAAQREAMRSLPAMDGVWIGPAWAIMPSGQRHSITQTERIGPFLDGAVKVVEGRGYDASGSVSFNALGIISYDPPRKEYRLQSYAQGREGGFVLTPNASGYVWEIPAGAMIIRYTAFIKDGTWREIGERIMPGQAPIQFFEMNLKRVGDSTWPAGDAVSMK